MITPHENLIAKSKEAFTGEVPIEYLLEYYHNRRSDERSRMNQLEYIRKRYGVDAHKVGRIRFMDDKNGTILGGRMGRLRVKFDDGNRTFLLHPTWEVEYLDETKGA